MTLSNLNRRQAIQTAAALTAPFVFRTHATAAPSETLYHASFGAGGMASADIGSLTRSKNLKLVAVADVDLAAADKLKAKFPDVRVYQDWRELLDKEKELNSVNVSTPDHMHAAITMKAIQKGLHVYTQKPLTRTIFEARALTKAVAEKKVVSQMGIQIHSHEVHKSVVAMIQAGAIGKVKEVHSWSGKHWGDRNPRPMKKDPIPAKLNWDLWLGVAAERDFISGYYHPGNWRKRLDFGTGTFGDMGCHILDPVFSSLALTSPLTVTSTGNTPNGDSWALESQVNYIFPGTPHTTETVSLTWYDGDLRPGDDVKKLVGGKLSDQGSVYIGTEGVMYSPYISAPILLPEEKFKDFQRPKITGDDHYLQFVEACRGNGTTSAPFSYAGPLTEMILLGCLSTRFPKTPLKWNTSTMTVTNVEAANHFVHPPYRKGWEVEGL